MLEQADYGLTQFAMEQSERNGYDQDSKLLVHFSMKPHLDKEKTKNEGRPIFTPKEYVTIIVPGDKTNIVNRPVWELDRRRFPKQYMAFKNNESQEVAGTPLDTVPWISREQVEELKYFNVRSLEHLAGLADMHAQRFMGIHKLRQRARDHIALAKEQAPAMRLAEELRTRDAKIDELQAQVALLIKQSTENEVKAKK